MSRNIHFSFFAVVALFFAHYLTCFDNTTVSCTVLKRHDKKKVCILKPAGSKFDLPIKISEKLVVQRAFKKASLQSMPEEIIDYIVSFVPPYEIVSWKDGRKHFSCVPYNPTYSQKFKINNPEALDGTVYRVIQGTQSCLVSCVSSLYPTEIDHITRVDCNEQGDIIQQIKLCKGPLYPLEFFTNSNGTKIVYVESKNADGLTIIDTKTATQEFVRTPFSLTAVLSATKF